MIRLGNTNLVNYANRGMTLESDINLTNEYYRSKNIALVYKKPVPIKIGRVDYGTSKIKEAYFEAPSTLDYNGVYKGKYLEFDAKETKSKTSFPISNIHKHQIEHIRRVIYYGGIAFLIVRFTTLDKTFFLSGEDLIWFLDNQERKSIPLSFFEEKGHLIKLLYSPRLDYMKVVSKIMEV